MLREELDHIEIGNLIQETTELRKDPEIRNKEEVERSWENFKESNSLDEEIIVDGIRTTLNDMMSF